jgi:hypothetical protein
MPPAKNVAYVEQIASSKVPILHPGDISPELMREFKNGCLDFFDSKEVPDKQVRKIIPGLKDTCIRDWMATRCEQIIAMSFKNFMAELHTGYLKNDWIERTHRQLERMTQDGDPFWEFQIRMQAKNSLLMDTANHLGNDKLCSRLYSRLDDGLAERCIHAKVNDIKEFEKWLDGVCAVDKLMRSERVGFEKITKATREQSRRTLLFAKPSSKANANVMNRSYPRKEKIDSGITCLPKLLPGERKLLFDNEGCLKCHQSFTGHLSMNCPNDFPLAASYRISQADVEKARHAGCTVASMSRPSGSNTDNSGAHPVTSIVGNAGAPIVYMPTNGSSVLEAGNDSDGSVSANLVAPSPTGSVLP